MDYQSGRDLLSDLPLSIIHIILALVPIRDAVRTSILSRQWRYTWASLPRLVFEDECISSDSKTLRKFERRAENSISRVLQHHNGPIHSFKIAVSFSTRSPNIDEWILCLSRNDIKELVLNMGDPYDHDSVEVHSSVYYCEKLTKLELWNCELDPPPSTFKGFLFLRCLFLHGVDMPSNEIESLVANAPLLERLELIDLIEPSLELRISSPNLKYLDISGDFIELCVSAPLLAEMSVSLDDDDDFTTRHQQQKGSVCNYTNFMGGFTNLEKLRGYEYFTKYLSMGIESCYQALAFHQLKDIELLDVDFNDIKVVSVVDRLIVGAPNLEKLKIQSSDEENDASEAPHHSFEDFGCGSDFTFAKLKVVEMSKVRGLRLELKFIEFLLRRSPVLETMRHSLASSGGLTEEKKRLIAKSLFYDFFYPNVKISF